MSKKNAGKAPAARSAPGRREIVGEIKRLTKKLERTPSRTELLRMTKIGRHDLNTMFLTYREALAACGLSGRNFRISLGELFCDWATVARKLGKIPTINEYAMHAKHSQTPLIKHFGGWLQVPAGLLRYAREQKLEKKRPDVVELLTWHGQPAPGFPPAAMRTAAALPKPRISADEPIYGAPFFVTPLAMAPTCENGVIFLFGAMARELGFMMVRLQTGFPDGEGFREVEPGRWQFKRIEFELESRNYRKHGHPAGGAHILVCWEHNWEECPLEVIELRKLAGKIGRSGDRA